MKVLILGASGATGKLVVTQLLRRNINVRIVVRENALLPEEIINSRLVEIVAGNIFEFDSIKNSTLIEGCDAVVCCLGHNITFKGIFGKPQMLVCQSLKNVCDAIIKYASKKVKVILMNTTANENPEIDEGRSAGEKIILSILTALLPPQKDNVYAARHLSAGIGKNSEKIEWTAVRPDTLINNEEESPYEVFEAPTRSPLFNAGKTSRINVSHFMAELLTNEEIWQRWKNKMPVIYNKEESGNRSA
jgi:nucleoside-diphosphate-sugar epimerase